jgi:Domain of unknown function (DUF4159)
MKLLRILVIAGLLSGLGVGVLAMQRGGYGFGEEDEGPPLPVDIHEKAEWAFARFHFPSGGDFQGGFRGFRIWAADYPKADRQFVRGLRRLTRLNARAMEEVVDADSDALFDWPWIYMEHGGVWNLNEAQAARLRAYLLKGGFLLSDDTHGDYEWDGLMRGMHMIFPDRAVEELKDKDEILHVVYDLDNRFQIHGTRFIWGGRPYSPDMVTPKWEAIRDDKGRIMVAICHNSDVGDAWEWADSPRYPENETSLAYRIGINYILYDLTH